MFAHAHTCVDHVRGKRQERPLVVELQPSELNEPTLTKVPNIGLNVTTPISTELLRKAEPRHKKRPVSIFSLPARLLPLSRLYRKFESSMMTIP